MRHPAQARHPDPRAPRAGLRHFALLALLALPGCTMSGANEPAVDAALVTSDVAGEPAAPEALSDQATIRDAVTSADLGEGARELAWANADTGSRGAITALAEERRGNGQLCRSFTTSRESYDGVALYQGEACKAQSGPWRMLDFKAL